MAIWHVFRRGPTRDQQYARRVLDAAIQHGDGTLWNTAVGATGFTTKQTRSRYKRMLLRLADDPHQKEDRREALRERARSIED